MFSPGDSLGVLGIILSVTPAKTYCEQNHHASTHTVFLSCPTAIYWVHNEKCESSSLTQMEDDYNLPKFSLSHLYI